MDEIPAELIVNFDQTALNYAPVTPWTMEKHGGKRVEVVVKDNQQRLQLLLQDHCQENHCHEISPQLLYEGKTMRCLPHYKFPSSWHITQSDNHW